MSLIRTIAVMAILVLLSVSPATAFSPDDCGSDEVKSFDYLVGEWRVKGAKGEMSITKILEGCGLQEIWKLEDFNAVLLRSYDSRKKVWYLTFTAHDLVPQVWKGRVEDGIWIFYRDWELDGKPRKSRTYWKPTSETSFEKVVEQLNDDGKSWRLHARTIFVKAEGNGK